MSANIPPISYIFLLYADVCGGHDPVDHWAGGDRDHGPEGAAQGDGAYTHNIVSGHR